MQRGNHEFFNNPRPSQAERRREAAAAPKPGIQVLSRPREEEKKPIVIASRPTTSVEVMSREKTGAQTGPKILPSPREAPIEKEMLDSRKLIGDGMYFEDSFFEFLTDNPHFSVTAAIGPQNAGKSTVLSMLAGNNPQDKYRYYVFRPASREAVESSRYQTVKIHAYVSKTRGIFLDCQATNSCSMVEDYTRYSRKIDDKSEITAYVENIQLIAFLLQISHTVLVVSDYTLDLELVKILRTAEMIRANYNRLPGNNIPPLNFLRKTNIVFVHTRAGSIDFHYPIHRERVLLIRSLFADSLRLRVSENDDLVLMMLSVLKPRKDTATLMHAPPQMERIYDKEEIVSFEDGIRQMRLLLAGISRDPFSDQPFTEKQWYSLAEAIWKDNGFLNAIHRLSNVLSMEEGSFLEPAVLAVITAIILIFATTIYLICRTIKQKDTILIVGLSDSGKTQVFSKIANKNTDPITTYTSLQENCVQLDIKGRPLKIVDFPGAERLRKQLVEKWLKKERDSLKKIVFVLDSASFTKRARDVAEFFYDVALESTKKVPIVVACNKQDLTLAKNQEAISSTLEKEIGLINKSRAAALTTTDGSSSNTTLTNTLDSFQWSDLKTSVDFVDCSVVAAPGLEELRTIIKQ